MRWPRVRPRDTLFEILYQILHTGAVRSGNPYPPNPDVGKMQWYGYFGGAGLLGDSRLFIHYNVLPGFIEDLAAPPKGNYGSQSHGSPTPQKWSWSHPSTNILRVTGTEGTTQAQLDEGWGGNSHAGWNLWWGGGYSTPVYQYIPVSPVGDAQPNQPGYPEAGPGSLEAGYYADNWSDYYVPNTTQPGAVDVKGTLCFRGPLNRNNQCPIFTGPDLGPKLFNKSTGSLASYEVPGPYPYAPPGSMMVRCNLAYWGPTKRHVPTTGGLGHDSYYVGQPVTPGLRRLINVWPEVASYVAEGTEPFPSAITSGFAVSYDIKIIGPSDSPASAFGKFWLDRNASLGFYPNTGYVSPGDTPHTHTWTLTSGAYTLSPPDWVSHLTVLVKGESYRPAATTPFFMGGPTAA